MYSFLYIVQFTQQCTVCSTMYSLLYKIELPLYFENFNVPFLTNCILPFFYKIVTFSLIKTVYVLYFNVELYCSFILKIALFRFLSSFYQHYLTKLYCSFVFAKLYFIYFTKLHRSFSLQNCIVPLFNKNLLFLFFRKLYCYFIYKNVLFFYLTKMYCSFSLQNCIVTLF